MTVGSVRDRGLVVGTLPPGPTCSIVDVAGVAVGHATLAYDTGGDCVRSGVTVVVPPGDAFTDPVPAAVRTINGYGKPTGFEQVRELGQIETPVALTSTLAVGAVHTGLVRHAIATHAGIGGAAGTVNPVVAECNDGYLSSAHLLPVQSQTVLEALADATSEPVVQGCVGAGTGTVAFGWKGGIGSASRVVGGVTYGVLAQTNMGRACDLNVAGVPVGRTLPPPGEPRPDRGSVVMVLATDGAYDPRQLGRLAGRVQNGLARTGCVTAHGSGEFVIAFSTARGAAPVRDVDALTDDVCAAVAEAVEEAVLCSLFCATTTSGREGRTVPALPVDDVLSLLVPHS